MSISGVSGVGFYLTPNINKTKTGQEVPDPVTAALPVASSDDTSSTEDSGASLSTAPSKKVDEAKAFLDFMKMTPAERMQYTWLAQHGISKEDFDAMSPEDKQKLMDKMKQEIEQQAKEQINNSKNSDPKFANILA